MKIAVYTTIVGLYDMPKAVNPEYLKEADFFLFADMMGTNLGYKSIAIKKTENSPRVESRRYKIMPHKCLPGYDYYIYLDGSIELLESPSVLIEKYLKTKDIALFRHRWRETHFEEFYYCFYWKPDLREKMDLMMKFFLTEGVPENLFLTENGVILRKNTPEINELNEYWWMIYRMFAERDQLSLPYCCWKKNIVYHFMEGDLTTTKEFKLYEHI